MVSSFADVQASDNVHVLAITVDATGASNADVTSPATVDLLVLSHQLLSKTIVIRLFLHFSTVLTLRFIRAFFRRRLGFLSRKLGMLP